MVAGFRVDQLHVYPEAVATTLHRAFEHIADVQLASQPLYIHGFALERKRGVARNHERSIDAGQVRGQALGHTINEVVLFRIATDVGEGQNDDGWPVRKRGARGTGSHGKIRDLRGSGDGTLVADAGRADEPIASSGHGLDPILAARLLPKHPT